MSKEMGDEIVASPAERRNFSPGASSNVTSNAAYVGSPQPAAAQKAMAQIVEADEVTLHSGLTVELSGARAGV